MTSGCSQPIDCAKEERDVGPNCLGCVAQRKKQMLGSEKGLGEKVGQSALLEIVLCQLESGAVDEEAL